MSVAQIAAMRSRIPDDLELEAFAHGSMCMAYSVRCNCLRDHNEADRQLYVCSNGDASHRQHHAPVAVLPPFRSQSVPDAASLPAHPAYRTRRKIPLDVAPFILHKGLRAPPVMA